MNQKRELKIRIPRNENLCTDAVLYEGTEIGHIIKTIIKTIQFAFSQPGKRETIMKQYFKPLPGGHEAVTYLWRTGQDEGIVVKCFHHKRSFMREWSCLKTIQNVAGVLQPLYADHTQNVLFFPYMSGGDLFEHLIVNGCTISSRDVLNILLFLVNTLLQMQPWSHGDIKLENVLCKTDLYGGILTDVRMIDVGLCGKGCGTIDYWPPEKHERLSCQYPEKGDVWALGVLFYNVFTREKPYEILEKDADFGIAEGRCKENFQKYTALSENIIETRDGIMSTAEDGFKNNERETTRNNLLGLILHGSDWSWETFLSFHRTRLKMAVVIVQEDAILHNDMAMVDIQYYRTDIERMLFSCSTWDEFCIRSNALIDEQKRVHLSLIRVVQHFVLMLRKMWIADPEKRISLEELQQDLQKLYLTFYETEHERERRLRKERQTFSSN